MPPRSTSLPDEAAPAPRRAPRSRAVRAPEPEQTPAPVVATTPLAADVTAVLVAHDGSQWLPETLRSLADSTRVPLRVICVDTGSTDGSADLLASAYGGVLTLPRTTGFGAAVAAGLATVEPSTWVWLLHDDVAVEPRTLEHLLDHAETSPSAALLGPKCRDWNDPRYLVEVGLTTDAAGHRETGLERREYDQGQHDAVRDVLAVGTAAALIRRDVWDAVGGIDPELTVFRDDLDLGWKVNAAGHRVVVVPEARVRHARAATTGHRETDAAPGRATGTDRRHALYVLLAHASAVRLLGLLPRLLLATVVRVLVLLLTRQVAAAGDEIRAVVAVLGRPALLHRARRQRAATRTVPQRALRPLFAARTVRIRARLAVVGDWLSGGSNAGNALGALGDVGPDSGDDFDGFDYSAGGGALRRLVVRPSVLLVAALSVVTLLAERGLLRGGRLLGGALLPAPGGTGDLWQAYLAGWHDVGVGTGQPTPPSTAALAGLSFLLGGSPSRAVSVLLLAAVPLAGLTAYWAACRLVRHAYLRIWVASTWALLPVATGTVAAGRLDTAATQIALPLVVLAAGRLLTDDPRVTGWWRAWALGLGLGVTCAFAPLLWPLSAAVLLVGAAANLLLHEGRRRSLAALIVAIAPGAVLLPWSLDAIAHPSLFAPRPQLAEQDLSVWHVLLLSPGGPGLPIVLVTVGLVLAALAGTVRLAFRHLALACWGVALVGYAGALLLTRVEVDGAPVWPGLALQLSALGLLAAALVAANGARGRLAQASFGPRQLAAGSITVLAALVPVVCAVTWVAGGAGDPLRRSSTMVLPAFARAELETQAGLRVLVLSRTPAGQVSYLLSRGKGIGLADAGLRSEAAQRRQLDAVVADLVSPRGSDAAEALSTRAVRYVALLDAASNQGLVDVLDGQSGLVRRTSGRTVLWQLVAPASRLTVLSPELATKATSGVRAPVLTQLLGAPPVAVPSGAQEARFSVPASSGGRLLVLADARDDRWRARIAGKDLPRRTAWGWAQGFDLPASGGQVEVSYDRSTRRTGLVAQGIVLLALVVLAAPGARRRRGLEDDVDVEQEPLSTSERRIPVAAL